MDRQKNTKVQKYIGTARCWLVKASDSEEEQALKQITSSIYYIWKLSYISIR